MLHAVVPNAVAQKRQPREAKAKRHVSSSGSMTLSVPSYAHLVYC